MASHGIVHVEFSANNRETSAKFYSDLFGWEIHPMPEANYISFLSQPGLGGGFVQTNGETPLTKIYKPGVVVVYVESADIESDLAKAEALGGKTLLPKTDIPGSGAYAIFSDPTGNPVGLYTGS